MSGRNRPARQARESGAAPFSVRARRALLIAGALVAAACLALIASRGGGEAPPGAPELGGSVAPWAGALERASADGGPQLADAVDEAALLARFGAEELSDAEGFAQLAFSPGEIEAERVFRQGGVYGLLSPLPRAEAERRVGERLEADGWEASRAVPGAPRSFARASPEPSWLLVMVSDDGSGSLVVVVTEGGGDGEEQG